MKPLLLISTLYHDPVFERVRQLHQAATWLVTNLCDTQATVDIGGPSPHDRILLNNYSFQTGDLYGIVVSGMPCRATPGYSPNDSRYIEHETVAAWMALLRTARCRVLNRPHFETAPAIFQTLHVRAVARAAGIPTIDDHICSGADLLGMRMLGDEIACVDLYDQSTFWLSAAHSIDDKRMYSATSLTKTAEQIMLAYVGGRCYSDLIPVAGHLESKNLTQSIRAEATSIAKHLANLLELDYAFYAFSLVSGHLQFCRAYTFWPTTNHNYLINWTATTILTELSNQ